MRIPPLKPEADAEFDTLGFVHAELTYWTMHSEGIGQSGLLTGRGWQERHEASSITQKMAKVHMQTSSFVVILALLTQHDYALE